MAETGKRTGKLRADRRYGAKPAPRRQAPRRTPPKRRPPQGPLGRFGAALRAVLGWTATLIWRLMWRGAVVLGLIIALAVGYQYSTLPPVTQLLDGRVRGSVTMLDRYGAVFAWRGDQFGGVITAETVSPHLKNAVIATEDKRFYRHIGIDPRGVASAVRINLREGRGPLSGHGGSTLTQQTAKLLCLGVPFDPDQWQSEAAYEADCRQGSLWRKMKEAVYALAMEVKYTKNDILTVYLNRAFLGAGARGFEAAAQRYFGKSAAEVTASEAAMLAGLLVAPTRYAPTNNLQRSQDRANLVLGLMADQGYLDPVEEQVAKANPATLSDAAEARRGGSFADWAMASAPSFLGADTTEDVIVRTTFDADMQRAAEEALTTIFETKVREGSEAQAAIVVMSSDGAVRAMVGGRALRSAGGFNRAVQAKRQTGSAFKPFVYAAALDLGWSPLSTVDDTPLTLNIPGSGPWSPKNYDRKFRGTVTLTDALKWSLNVPAVRTSEAVGRDAVRQVATHFGIESDLAAGPALALGASESSLLEMTGAYAGILNGGRSVTPYGLVELRTAATGEPLITQTGGFGERVVSEGAARQLTWMMNKVVTEGTGGRAALTDRPVAGKTGTTQAARDAWFVGFTGDYVAGVWMGYDDNRPLTGVTGSGLPADIWRETMSRIHAGRPASPLPMDPPRPVLAPPQDTTASRPQGNTVLEDVILDVLGRILGGN